MEDDVEQPEQGTVNVVAQAAAAGALVLTALGAMWGLGVFDGTTPGSARAAACQAPKATDPAEYPALCAALNRPDLPELLGSPTEKVSLAYSAGGTSTFADGTKVTDVAAEVQLGTVTVRLVDEPGLSVKDSAGLLPLVGRAAAPVPVLGHPATGYWDHTVSISLGGGTSTPGPGGVARHLLVAKSPKDDGCFELVVWRQDGQAPDDATLLRIAEKVLPTAPGWVTTVTSPSAALTSR